MHFGCFSTRVNDADAEDGSNMKRRFRVAILMAVAYSANIGGTGSLIGSSPQLALKGILNESVSSPLDNDLIDQQLKSRH